MNVVIIILVLMVALVSIYYLCKDGIYDFMNRNSEW